MKDECDLRTKKSKKDRQISSREKVLCSPLLKKSTPHKDKRLRGFNKHLVILDYDWD